MEDAPKFLNIQISECPDIWIRLPRHKWPKSWSSMEDPAVPLERNLYGHPLAGLLWETQFEKIRFGEPSEGPIIQFGSLVQYYTISAKDRNIDGRKFPIGNAHSCTMEKDYSYQCMSMIGWEETKY